ncbi:hypothetical protein PHYPSEUDO_005063 [Phytophthora pseudosyringae]|uniref:SP-RING-type domain-containing protein n=1 Tax=Phytophthora pseudosyringae TaxID=221518 RepID=A0A8T1VLR9_9STRA|nr:hypothetical protein PHYPSEUDO_005063 [Phytophthora pseudosyringae]
MQTHGRSRQRRAEERDVAEPPMAAPEEQTAALIQQNEALEQEKRELESQCVTYAGKLEQCSQKISDAEAALRREKSVAGRLVRRLREQSAVCEAERQRADLLQLRLDGSAQRQTKEQQADVNLSLETAMPHLRGLMAAYERGRGRHARGGIEPIDLTQDTVEDTSTTSEPASSQALTPLSSEHPTVSDQGQAQLSEQASDAAITQQDISRRSLLEREAVLTCPISLDLFENPVVTKCCGKTFSAEALEQARRCSSFCPFCRSRRVKAYPNRDVEKLVELHRSERSVLGMSEAAAPSPATAARTTTSNVVATESGQRRRRRTEPTSTRQSRHREQRSQRVHIRSGVPRQRSSGPSRLRATLPTEVTVEPTLSSAAAASTGSQRRERSSRRPSSTTRAAPSATTSASSSTPITALTSSGLAVPSASARVIQRHRHNARAAHSANGSNDASTVSALLAIGSGSRPLPVRRAGPSLRQLRRQVQRLHAPVVDSQHELPSQVMQRQVYGGSLGSAAVAPPTSRQRQLPEPSLFFSIAPTIVNFVELEQRLTEMQRQRFRARPME